MTSLPRALRLPLAALAVLCTAATLPAQTPAAPARSTAASVPRDLKPLLQAPGSEMQLVVRRYELDRGALTANYFGGAPLRGFQWGGGRQQPSEASDGPNAVILSRERIARLERFDMEWQAALSAMDQTGLTPAAKADITKLQAAIASNLAALEADTAARARALSLVPFAPAIVDLYEARVRMANVDSKGAAGALTRAASDLAALQARLEAGLTGAADGATADPALARDAAALTRALREHLTAWFDHYDGYDPVFMWWVDMPYRKIDDALDKYATLLETRVASANQTTNLAPSTDVTIEPSPAPPISSVPDLAMIIALPQDELRGIVESFRAGRGGGGGGRGRGNATPPAPPAGSDYYRAWLGALESLDFDSLTRNAQVDYLYIKRTSQLALTRADAKPQQNIPRRTDNSGIEGAARGRDGLLLDLGDELIPYTPEQLIELGNREYVWTVEEMKKASRELGFGDNWMEAVEHVKQQHVEPGRQREIVRDMLYEAVDYLRANDLLTVPQVASEALRMRMLSPQEQLTAPFFLGGSMILVAYPTNTMEYDTRIQAMRGNNIYFSHAVAHHEMIPGHNLVGFMGARFGNSYRPTLGGTPFLGEGWPLYWETILYDKGFHDTPEERIGALFWRMHRAARIVFSMNFHMGRWSPQECIDFLVNEVGHERDNATAEVRRSFAGNYGPLYQMAYLVGGLQIRGIRKELVDSGQMTEKAFHNEILRQGSMPVAYLRLALRPGKLTKDTQVEWPFYGELPGAPDSQ